MSYSNNKHFKAIKIILLLSCRSKENISILSKWKILHTFPKIYVLNFLPNNFWTPTVLNWCISKYNKIIFNSKPEVKREKLRRGGFGGVSNSPFLHPFLLIFINSPHKYCLNHHLQKIAHSSFYTKKVANHHFLKNSVNRKNTSNWMLK